MYRFGGERWYLRAGRMNLPYGLRLQDQQAFVRQVTGINMDTPDDGMEIGYLYGPWNAQLAISNGTAGGAENNNGKQYTALVSYVRDSWRVGANGNHNDGGSLRSTSGGVFGGLRTGPVAWLAEGDIVNVQNGATPEQHLAAAILEANWHALPGGNLKFTAEWLDPDRDHNGPIDTRPQPGGRVHAHPVRAAPARRPYAR